MNDYSELKLAALSATQGARIVSSEWTDEDVEYQREEFTITTGCGTLEIKISGSFLGKDEKDAAFIAAASPSVVLDMVGELECAQGDLRQAMQIIEKQQDLLRRTLDYYTESCFPEDLLVEVKAAIGDAS